MDIKKHHKLVELLPEAKLYQIKTPSIDKIHLQLLCKEGEVWFDYTIEFENISEIAVKLFHSGFVRYGSRHLKKLEIDPENKNAEHIKSFTKINDKRRGDGISFKFYNNNEVRFFGDIHVQLQKGVERENPYGQPEESEEASPVYEKKSKIMFPDGTVRERDVSVGDIEYTTFEAKKEEPEEETGMDKDLEKEKKPTLLQEVQKDEEEKPVLDDDDSHDEEISMVAEEGIIEQDTTIEATEEEDEQTEEAVLMKESEEIVREDTIEEEISEEQTDEVQTEIQDEVGEELEADETGKPKEPNFQEIEYTTETTEQYEEFEHDLEKPKKETDQGIMEEQEEEELSNEKLGITEENPIEEFTHDLNKLIQRRERGEMVDFTYINNEIFKRLMFHIYSSETSLEEIWTQRTSYEMAFKSFDIDSVSQMVKPDIDSLMSKEGIIRNRPRIDATVINSQVVKKILEEYNSFAEYLLILRQTEQNFEEIFTKMKVKGFRWITPVLLEEFFAEIGL